MLAFVLSVGITSSFMELCDGQQFNGIAEFRGVLDIHWRDARDAFDVHLFKIDRATEG